ncbi:cytochrome b/b6 domain-containing protein [Sinimarinibacterium thermocellulolyticum]|uniref:Cytochrome b/b6 domain-containing protein n=1 Tax=Sinimarinibacterium thermocellulolyticum TaxID=3170016 RepID=A0ABV2ABM2_9GAMM
MNTPDHCQQKLVWDVPTRLFHWLNAACVLALMAIGLVILNAGALDVSNDGKVALKTLHVWIGYVFALNLMMRIVWAFVGGHYARWRQILPGGAGYLSALRDYLAAFAAGRSEPWLGHNPAGRLAIGVLLILLTMQAVTGLVLAGTDLFYPPLGAWIAQSIAAPGVDPSTLVPYATALYDAEAYARMRELREPVVNLHVWGFYLLLAMSLLHMIAVVVTEIREGGNLVSAMITGRKTLRGQPRDAESDATDREPG